jgi:hypothetical protein
MARKRGFRYNPSTQVMELWVDNVKVGSWSSTPTSGKVYHVNNITGSASASGLSWSEAFDQVDTAITASEAYRTSQSTNNQYIRNVILIQGTATAYEAVSVANAYNIDFIGVGDTPWGCGIGVARITGGGAANGFTCSTACIGCTFTNIRFEGSGAYSAAYFPIIVHCEFEDCAFMGDELTNSSLTNGLYVNVCGSTIIKHCHIGTDWARPTTGMRIGTDFGNCEVSDCHIVATTNGVIYSGGTCLDDQTIWKNNVILAATYGYRNPYSGAGEDQSFLVGNWICSTDAISRSAGVGGLTGDDISLGNWVNNGGTAAMEHTYTV